MEDEYFLADDLAHALSAAGAKVVGPFGDVTTALALLEGDAPVDGAILDLNLHGEMSYTVAAKLEARGIPFLIGTGYTADPIKSMFPHVPYWQKPFSCEQLVQSLQGLWFDKN